MSKYIAFLRGINVGGHKIIKMEDLRKMFEKAGMKSVKTYIQSGNAVFETDENKTGIISEKISEAIHKASGFDVDILIITLPELKKIIKNNPFPKVIEDKDTKVFITMLAGKPSKEHISYIDSLNNDHTEISVKGNNVYMVLKRNKGRVEFPNAFMERRLKMLSTTRNPTTLSKMIELAEEK